MNKNETDGAKQKLSALIDFGNLINSSLNLKFILDNLLLTCFGKFHTTRGIVLLKNDCGLLEAASFKGISNIAVEELPAISLSDSREKNLIFDEFFSAFASKNKLAVSIPVATTQEVHGYLVLGERFGGREYTPEDISFLNTIVNIASTAIENSLIVDKLKTLNRNLDSKVSMLSSLFELSKEFSGILDTQRVCKLLGFTIMGQLLVHSYAIVVCNNGEAEVLESKFPAAAISGALATCTPANVSSTLRRRAIVDEHPALAAMGAELMIPMQIHGETKGLVILGKRLNQTEYSETDIEFLYSLASLAIVSIENSRLFKEALEKQKMEEDLEIARQIQRNLLPQSIPQLAAFDIAAVNVTSRQVGGDYYDLIRLDKTHLLFAIGDVAGKGVPASLMMANLQAFLKSICKQGMEIDKATNLLNDLVSENTMLGSFITFFWGIIDEEKMTITYVNAGHNPPILARADGSMVKLTKGGMILGVVKTIVPYVCEEISVSTGDLLVLFTDGVTEAMNARLEEFSDERLESMVPELRPLAAQEALDTLSQSVQSYVDGAVQSDDITIMMVKAR